MKKLLLLVNSVENNHNFNAVYDFFYETAEVHIGGLTCSFHYREHHVEWFPVLMDDYSPLIRYIVGADFDLVVNLGYNLYNKALLTHLDKKLITLCPTLLPKYRNCEDPYAEAFISGDPITGSSVYYLSQNRSDNDMISQVAFRIPLIAKNNVDMLRKLGQIIENELLINIIKNFLDKGYCKKSDIDLRNARTAFNDAGVPKEDIKVFIPFI